MTSSSITTLPNAGAHSTMNAQSAISDQYGPVKPPVVASQSEYKNEDKVELSANGSASNSSGLSENESTDSSTNPSADTSINMRAKLSRHEGLSKSEQTYASSDTQGDSTDSNSASDVSDEDTASVNTAHNVKLSVAARAKMLRSEGEKIEEIAVKLEISTKAVESYLGLAVGVDAQKMAAEVSPLS